MSMVLTTLRPAAAPPWQASHPSMIQRVKSILMALCQDYCRLNETAAEAREAYRLNYGWVPAKRVWQRNSAYLVEQSHHKPR